MDPYNTFEAYKNKIGERLTMKLIKGLEERKVTEDQYMEIGKYILDNIDKATTNLQLLDFVEHLASKWPIFADVAENEEAQAREDGKDEKVQQVENLINENKLDEALKVATDANNTQGGVN